MRPLVARAPGLALAPSRPAAAAAASKRRPALRHPATCAAATEEDRDSRTQGRRASSSSGGGGGSAASGSSSRAGPPPSSDSSRPLLDCIRDCSSAAELHELLVSRAREVHGREVSAALEVAAQRGLVRPPRPAAAPAGPRSNDSINGSSSHDSSGSSMDGGGSSGSSEGTSSSSSSRSNRQLAKLLVQLALHHAADFEPPHASAAAWALSAMQLGAAVPAVRTMHTVAAHQLSHYSPSQFCSLLWAGSRLDRRYRSPLFPELLSLLQQGLDLSLFTAQDLAVLALLCGRDNGGPAREVLQAVASECRTRIEMYAIALQHWAEAELSGAAAAEHTGEAGQPEQQRRRRRRQQEQLQEQAAGAAPPPPPPPLRPFTIAQAALLLTGLAKARLRVGGLVEPMLLQCESEIGQAAASDVARILIALGELHMEVGGELLPALLNRLASIPGDLSPQEMAAAAWTLTRFNARLYGLKQLPTLAIRHMNSKLEEYSTADTICVLWALAHFKRTLPDATLQRTLRALEPHVAQCSTSALCNLLWALGRAAGVASGAIKAKRQRSLDGDWISTPVGAELLALASATTAELARRKLKLHELAAAATAVAAHAEHAAELPAAPVTALRRACTAAAAARGLSPTDLAHVAGAAARLRWQDTELTDALASDMQARGSSWPSEAFTQCVWALATLAPSRYGPLFESLARSYAAKVLHPERSPAYVAPFGVEERQTVLAAFAAVSQAQRLPRATMAELVETIKPTDLKGMPAVTAAALLVLAAGAGLQPEAPVVQACCTALKRHLRQLSMEQLRQARAGLQRLHGSSCDDELLASIEGRIDALASRDT